MKDPYEMKEAKTAILINYPFWGTLLMQMMTIHYDENCPTLATDGRRIIVNPKFFCELPLPKRIFALAHEIGHAMWRHCDRMKYYMEMGGIRGMPYSPQIYNYAGDYVINDLLVTTGVGQIDPDWLHDPRTGKAGDLVEDVYERIYEKIKDKVEQAMKDMQDGSGGQGDPDGEGQGNPKEGAVGRALQFFCKGDQFDEHQTPSSTTSEGKTPQQEEMEWKQAINNAVANAKAVGKMPGDLARFVEDLVEPQVPWAEKLRAKMTRKIASNHHSWRRFNRRRMVTQNMVMPGRTGHGCQTIVYVGDTSGSISDDEHRVTLSELAAILNDVNPEKVYVLWCDANINRVDEIETVSDMEMIFEKGAPGGGGTDFRPPFEWVEDKGLEPDALVYLTDMYGPFPDHDPGYPVFWISTTEKDDAPFGEVIHVNV